jgi:hypothetical protein
MCRFRCPICHGDGISLKGKIFAGRFTPAACKLCNSKLIHDPGISGILGAIESLLMFCFIYWAFMTKSWLPIAGFFICGIIADMFIPLVNKDRGKE